MSNPTIVHRLRQLKGAYLQADQGPSLYALELQLEAMGLTHPYQLIRNSVVNQLKPLLAIPEFAAGARGKSATAGRDFLYHLTSMRKVLSFTRWTYLPSGFPTIKHPERTIFDYLMDDYRRSGDWLPLRSYAEESYSGFRGFTWWTSQELLRTQIVCDAHGLGLPNKWVPKYGMLLRCPTYYARTHGLPRIPSVTDGFISEIFRPADLRANSSFTAGRTIDLEGPGPLVEGAEEFTLPAINVEAIDFQPVLIDRSLRRHVVKRDVRLWQLLEIFYHSL